MADTAKRLVGPTQLTTSATTVYTVPGSTTATILHIIVVNTTASTASAFYLSIGADAVGTRIVHKYPIPASDIGTARVEIKGYIVMTAAEILQAYADDASTITLTISGSPITASF